MLNLLSKKGNKKPIVTLHLTKIINYPLIYVQSSLTSKSSNKYLCIGSVLSFSIPSVSWRN